MAVTKIEVAYPKFNLPLKAIAPVKVTGELASTEPGYDSAHTKGAIVPIVGKGERIVLHLKSATGGAVRIATGTNEVVAVSPLDITLGANEETLLVLETGRYAQLDGQYRDHFVISTGLTDLTVAAVQSPLI